MTCEPDKARGLVQAFAHQCFMERRGPIKAVHCWLPIAALMLADPAARTWRPALASCQVFAACALYAQFCILVNDLADRTSDAASGRSSWARGLAPGSALALAAFVALAGAAALLPGSSKTASLATYGFALVLGWLYSAKPLRLKSRGLAGLAAYSLSTMLAYAILPWVKPGGGGFALLFLAPAVFFDKWTNLHAHQIVDSAGDRKGHLRTYAVVAGAQRARTTLTIAAAVASAAMAASLLILARSLWAESAGLLVAAAVLAAGSALCLCVARARLCRVSPLSAELPFWYLTLSFLAFRLFPVVVLGWLSLEHPALWMLFLPALATVAVETLSALGRKPGRITRGPGGTGPALLSL